MSKYSLLALFLFELVQLIGFYFISCSIARSIEIPLQYAVQLLKNLNIQKLENEIESKQYEHFFTSYYLEDMYVNMIVFINSLYYQQWKNIDDEKDTDILIDLSRAKLFFKKIGNLQAMGVIANNIASIHLKNDRVFEAINEI